MRPVRRLIALEGALGSTDAVLLWLEGAHRYPTPEAYVRTLLDGPEDARPMAQIRARVEAYIRRRRRGSPGDELDRIIRDDVGDALCSYQLALRLEGAARELLDPMPLRIALIHRYLGDLVDDPLWGTPAGRAGAGGAPLRASWRRWSDAARSLATEVRVETEARQLLQDRYLRSHDALFTDTAEAWGRLEHDVAELVRRAAAASPGGRPRPSRRTSTEDRRQALSDAVTARAHVLADDARITTHEALGETDAARAITAEHLRARDPFAGLG